ncbi:acyltransferase family protein [Dickeya zeae]|uniref:acyltransferase family protein n=1 Tax=Dickeya zeae TaxID=204042 RepID=UPI0003A83006|nr:acyltransferase family protein [Dickeya zeae]
MTKSVYSASAVEVNVTYWPGIEPVRVLLAIIVVVLHANFQYAPQGYLAVELFFMISGFLIASRKKDTSSVFFRFLKNISLIYPSYFLSILLMLMVSPARLHDVILSFSLLQAIGLNEKLINIPAWFLTCYLWVWFFYSFLHSRISDRDLYAFSIFSAIVGYVCLYSLTPAKGLNYTTEVIIGFLPPSIIRAMAGIGLGIALYATYRHLPRIELKRSIISIFEIVIIFLCFYIFLKHPASVEMDTSFLPLGFLFLYFLVSNQGLVSNFLSSLGQRFTFWRSASFDLFIFHFPLFLIVRKVVGHPPLGISETLLTITGVCFISLMLGFTVRAIKPVIYRYVALK